MSVYVGIHNNGALCYLISVIQQLYFMHDFKEVIMRTNSENEKAQALIDKLQILFTAMDHQQEIDDIQCEPIFNHLYPNLADGIYTQKDASEFLSDLIRSTGLDTHLKGTLTGQLVNTLSAEDDGSGVQRHLERPEKFLFTSLTVNCPDGINNLEASLQDFTKTETIQFRWPQQPNAVPAAPLSPVSTQKQTMFQTLPKHLTFHLKRFKFNVATMKKEKLHHRFEFPNELDMSPYISQTTVPSQPNSETETATDTTNQTLRAMNSPTSYRYQLSGVVVHKGKSAYRGHYYSFVRERSHCNNANENSTTVDVSAVTTSNETDRATTSANINADLTNVTEGMQNIALLEPALPAAATFPGDRWFLFDDFDVMPFNPTYLDVECFGGPRVKKYSSFGRSRSDSGRSDRNRRSNSSHGSKNSSACRSEASQQSNGSGSARSSVKNENEVITREDHQPDQANTDVVESIAECVESISDNVDVLAIHADESENGDAESTASSCTSEKSSSDDDETGSSENSENSESSGDDSSSYASDRSEESSDESDQSEEEGSYVPTRGKFKSAFLLFYDRIEV
eukprot:gene11657-13543_t